MPYASDETVKWANKVLSTGGFQARKAMLTTNPVLPPSGGITLAAITGHAGRAFDAVVKLNYSKLKIGAASDSIKFIKLRPNEKNEVGAMTFVMKNPDELPTVASRLGWTAVWWLPWQNSHVVKIKIRSKLTDPTIAMGLGVAPVDNPDIFFTAAINGCSVFAVGDTKAPSLYHGGVDGGMTVRNPNETTEAAWRRLLGRIGSAKNIQGIGKSDYVSELNPNPADDDDRLRVNNFKTTTAANALEQNLLLRGNLTNISVSPFGMVFGLRDISNDWAMTLVKNAHVSYRRIHVVRKKRFLRSDKVRQVDRGEIRHARTYDAEGDVTTQVSTVEQASQYCVTLGFQDFFPGAGQVMMHNLNQITLF